MSIQWCGWGVYTDAGVIYRRWKFEKDVPELKAEKGFLLHDVGPGVDPRFRVRDGTDRVYDPSVEELEEHLFPWTGLPRWRPPTADGLALEQSLEKLTEVVRGLSMAMRARESGEKKPESVPEKQNGPTKQNRYLRLKGEYEYTDGDPYRDWELLVDAPSIPASRRGDIHPRHAIKGDVLRERDDDELTPFQLRREGKRIGDPEWWQVRHLFEGLDATIPEPALPEGWGGPPDTPDGRILATVLPHGVMKSIVTGQSTGAGWKGSPFPRDDKEWNGSPFQGSAWLTSRPVPDLGLPTDAVVLFSEDHRLLKDVREVFDKGRQLPRPDFPTLLEHLDALRFVDASGCLNPEAAKHSPYLERPPGEKAARQSLRRYLAREASWTGKTKSVRVAMIVPLVSPVSSPIEAGSDAEAAFELLYQVSRDA